jgi:23S rRNA (cytosine1962-C5)-methyltransferase
MIQIQTPVWQDYELIDSGNRYKLERFGNYVLSRPEPQAVWDPALPQEKWRQLAHVHFALTGKGGREERGEWQHYRALKEPWFVQYKSKQLSLRFRLALTAFKHVGLFPEQAANWEYIASVCKRMQQPKVLNLFAYTGGASLAARQAGAEVVHVDAVRQVVNWASQNQEASKLDGIRWVVEDAMKFVQREVKRGRKYQGILLDPPAYGRGPNGEKWVLEDHINELMQLCAKLLDEQQHFFLLNLYSVGFSALIAESLTQSVFRHLPAARHAEVGELYVPDHAGRKLPLGTYLRFQGGF